MRVNELEEQGPKRFDLAAAGHVDAAGAKRGHQTKVGTREGEHSKEELFLGPVWGEIHIANTLIPSDIAFNAITQCFLTAPYTPTPIEQLQPIDGHCPPSSYVGQVSFHE